MKKKIFFFALLIMCCHSLPTQPPLQKVVAVVLQPETAEAPAKSEKGEALATAEFGWRTPSYAGGYGYGYGNGGGYRGAGWGWRDTGGLYTRGGYGGGWRNWGGFF